MDVQKVAKLANITLTSAQEDKFGKQLEKILDYISQLKKVDTQGVEPTSQVTGKVNSTRKDELETCLKLDQDYFKVAAIFDNE